MFLLLCSYIVSSCLVQSMQMGVSVLISYRTSGVLSMMSQRFLHLSRYLFRFSNSVIQTFDKIIADNNHCLCFFFLQLCSRCSVIPTQTRLRTQKLLAYSARASVSTTDVLRRLSNRAGPLINNSHPSL